MGIVGFIRELFNGKGSSATWNADDVEALPEAVASIPLLPASLLGDGAFRVQIVGESHYQSALERLVRRRTGEALDDRLTAVLLLEADNPYDDQAVSVHLAGSKVGHLNRTAARSLRQRLLKLSATGDQFACPARLTGGWDRGNGDQGYIGVELDIVFAKQR